MASSGSSETGLMTTTSTTVEPGTSSTTDLPTTTGLSETTTTTTTDDPSTSTTSSTTDPTTTTDTSTTDTTDTSTTDTTGPAPFCGDGNVDDGEECDDGNAEDTDTCTSACVNAKCGDSIVGPGEFCDDGNQVDDDECTNACALASCGDGIIQPGVGGEECDDGNDLDNDACLSTCLLAKCGDMAVQEGTEECDDGNDLDNDACLPTCVDASCGDGFVQDGVEACDDANDVDTDECLQTCVAASCGDGIVQAGVEDCDDGNKVDADACSNACEAATCNDNKKNAAETDIDCGGPDCDGCALGEVCMVNGDCESDQCMGGTCFAPKSCKTIKMSTPNATDGIYQIDPDGPNGNPAFNVFCDMTVDGGGWTLTYKIRNEFPQNQNPFWPMVILGAGTTFPTSLAMPVGFFEGPTSAARASLTAAIGATEWRTTLINQQNAFAYDFKSSYVDNTGQGLRCIASGTCTIISQTCSAQKQGVLLKNTIGGPIAEGQNAFICDVGWSDCNFCVDWSELRTDNNAGGDVSKCTRYMGDTAINLGGTRTVYWIR